MMNGTTNIKFALKFAMQCDGRFCGSNPVIQAAWNGYLSEPIAHDGSGSEKWVKGGTVS